MSVEILCGDARAVLAGLPAASVHACVTSPPYFNLRSYGGGPLEIGTEGDPRDYVAHLVDVFRGVWRVLRDDGTCWVVIGDSYCTRSVQREHGNRDVIANMEGKRDLPSWRESAAHGRVRYSSALKGQGLKDKDLMLIPHRVAIALQDDRWYVRNDCVWAKGSAMPESVQDRFSRAHEYVFHLAKSERYYFDPVAVAEKSVSDHASGNGYKRAHRLSYAGRGQDERWTMQPTRNRRSVLHVNPQPFSAADFGIKDVEHYACVDAETEALTLAGWRKQEDLQDGDVIAAYDPGEHVISWQAATFHRYPYDGPLVAIEKRGSSQRLTPNHRCLVAARQDRYAGRVVRADQLIPDMRIPLTAPFAETQMSSIGVDMAALLGWYVAEGHNTYPGYLSIYQSLACNEAKVGRIRDLLTSVGAHFYEQKRPRTWRGRDATCLEFVVRGATACTLQALAPSKKLTHAIMLLPRDEAHALLDAMIAGDGHARRDDGRLSLIQKDKSQIDLMQMLALRLGYQAVVSTRADSGMHTLYVTSGTLLTLRGTNGEHRPLGREQYAGIVWCPSVASGFWLARRNGKPFLTGNTFPEKLVEILTLCSTSEAGCCPRCLAPWRRVVRRTPARPGVTGGVSYGGATAAATDVAGARQRLKMRGGGFGGGSAHDAGWQPICPCQAGPPVPCRVLDVFCGSGTTGLVAKKLGRDFTGIELNESYVRLSEKRIASAPEPLFSAAVLAGDGASAR